MLRSRAARHGLLPYLAGHCPSARGEQESEREEEHVEEKLVRVAGQHVVQAEDLVIG